MINDGQRRLENKAIINSRELPEQKNRGSDEDVKSIIFI
jgi:hypothetical protein